MIQESFSTCATYGNALYVHVHPLYHAMPTMYVAYLKIWPDLARSARMTPLPLRVFHGCRADGVTIEDLATISMHTHHCTASHPTAPPLPLRVVLAAGC